MKNKKISKKEAKRKVKIVKQAIAELRENPKYMKELKELKEKMEKSEFELRILRKLRDEMELSITSINDREKMKFLNRVNNKIRELKRGN